MSDPPANEESLKVPSHLPMKEGDLILPQQQDEDLDMPPNEAGTKDPDLNEIMEHEGLDIPQTLAQ